VYSGLFGCIQVSFEIMYKSLVAHTEQFVHAEHTQISLRSTDHIVRFLVFVSFGVCTSILVYFSLF